MNSLQTKQLAVAPTAIIYAVAGAMAVYGCKVTQGASAIDMGIALEGAAVGDESRLNPDREDSPVRAFQYPNIASLQDGAFVSTDLVATVETPPASTLARYDIAYIYVGPFGAGFAIATGTATTGVKAAYVGTGLLTVPYGDVVDPVLPVGAFPVARIYVDSSTAITNAKIADIRNFVGRLQSAPSVTKEIKAASFTAAPKFHYFVDVTAGPVTVTLPPAPTLATAAVIITHYKGTITTNNITVARNGQTIMGAAADLTLNTANATTTLTWVSAAEGWRLGNL